MLWVKGGSADAKGRARGIESEKGMSAGYGQGCAILVETRHECLTCMVGFKVHVLLRTW